MSRSGYHTCPRRAEDGMDRDDLPLKHAGSMIDTWDVRRKDGPRQCSYCGSVSPEQFIEYLKDGGELGVTDKNYKAYLGDAGTGKFYYQHLSVEQRHEFIDLLNARKVKFQEIDGTVLDFRYGSLPFFVNTKGPAD